jgi:hypothetical protein
VVVLRDAQQQVRHRQEQAISHRAATAWEEPGRAAWPSASPSRWTALCKLPWKNTQIINVPSIGHLPHRPPSKPMKPLFITQIHFTETHQTVNEFKFGLDQHDKSSVKVTVWLPNGQMRHFGLLGVVDISETIEHPMLYLLGREYPNGVRANLLLGGTHAVKLVDYQVLFEHKLAERSDDFLEFRDSQLLITEEKILFLYESGVLEIDQDFNIISNQVKYLNDTLNLGRAGEISIVPSDD